MRRTVFILGAGASKPYGYPTGQELRHYICKNFPGDLKRLINDGCFKNYESDELNDLMDSASKFSEAFYKSSTPSIDLFLARNKGFSNMGKIAILSKILLSENKSRFREDVYEQDDWYTYLYRKMTSNMIEPDSYNNFKNNEVSFITFNYDRSLEHFLSESLFNSFISIPPNVSSVALIPFPFLHVYGVVSKLPWQDKICFRYGEGLHHIEKMVNNIKIIYEQETKEIEEIQSLIFNAERIIFLGFGYAKENIDVLGIYHILNIVKSKENRPEIHGTALGFTKKELQGIQSFFPYAIKLYDVNSSTLLREIL